MIGCVNWYGNTGISIRFGKKGVNMTRGMKLRKIGVIIPTPEVI